MTEIYKGLVGVVVDETSISKVMPETNSLTYRGYAVQDLCEHCRFEEVAYLLWHKELPTSAQLAAFEKQERAARGLSPVLHEVVERFPTSAHPMDALRTAVSFMGMEDPKAWENAPEDLLRKSIEMLAKFPTVTAAVFRRRKGQDPVAPRDDLSFSQNFFYMCFGEEAEEEIVRCFDISMILYAEHSFNVSTFSARTIASSLSDIYSTISGAVGSLKGPLHGGANEAVMNMLLEIDDPSRAKAWIEEKIAKKALVMGFGHRVYKKGDSRVPTMDKAFRKVAELRDGQKWVEMEDIIAKVFIEQKNIHPNLDYPAGPAYYLMGFDIDFFTPFFVMSRISGWTAHVIEQLGDNKLIRPLSAYTGENQRQVTPLAKR